VSQSYSNHPLLAVTGVGLVGVAAGLAAAAAGRCDRVVVAGSSMAPGLLPGDRLLVWRNGRVRPGDLVVVRDPRGTSRTVVKRVAAVGDAGVDVRGDNPAASTDSRTWGTVAWGLVVGRPVYRYHPPPRVGWLDTWRRSPRP